MPSTKRKKPQPKPSTLLDRALKLFGKGGAFWVKGDEKVRPGQKGESGIDEEYRTFTKFAYCSIGACKKVNTAREREAILYLARVIDPLFNVKDVGDSSKEAFNGGEPLTKKDIMTLRDEAENVVIEFNDSTRTRWKDLRKAFKKAIALAKKEKN
jgi:hypothetical protein